MTRARYDKCKQCGKDFPNGEYWGSKALDKNGLCLYCAPPSSTCRLGERCEFECIIRFDPDDAVRLRQKRLCAAHATEFDDRLHAAVMRLHPPPPPEAQPKGSEENDATA